MLISLLALLGVCSFAIWDANNGGQYSWLLRWLGLGLALLVAVMVTAMAWKAFASKLIDARLVVFVVAFWILSLGLFYSVGSIGVPEWRLKISTLPVVGLIIGSWIPAGLAISLPRIVARLRHVD